jgi:hypothetical protein
VKQSSFYHLLLTLGVFLFIIGIYYSQESFAISAIPSDRLRLSDAPFVPRLFLPLQPSIQDENKAGTLSKTALAMIGLQEENQGPAPEHSDVDTKNNDQSPKDGVRDCNEAKKLYSKGLALADNSDEEAQFYLRAIELCQDFSEAHNKLGEIYKSQGKYDLAIREFTQAKRKWHFVAPFINLGEIYRMQGRYDLAETEFVEAVRIQPDSHEAWNQLKYIRKRLGEYDSFTEIPRGESTPSAIFTRIPAMTLPKGTWSIDLVFKFWEENSVLTEDMIIIDEPLPPDRPERIPRIRDMELWILGLRYGLTSNFTIGLLPRHVERTAHYFRKTQSVSGLGDTILLTKYHLWGRRKTHISLFHLLGIPTGDDDAAVFIDDTLFQIPLGAGSFTFTPGIAMTLEKKPFTIITNLSYRFSDSDRVADEFRCDLAFILPRFHNFESMLEFNYRWNEDMIGTRLLGDITILAPGGQTLFISPGMKFFLPHEFKFEMGFQLPAIDPPDGSWLEETIFHFGLKKDFF